MTRHGIVFTFGLAPALLGGLSTLVLSAGHSGGLPIAVAVATGLLLSSPATGACRLSYGRNTGFPES